MFQTALRLARHRGLLESGRRVERQQFAAEIDDVRHRIACVERQQLRVPAQPAE